MRAPRRAALLWLVGGSGPAVRAAEGQRLLSDPAVRLSERTYVARAVPAEGVLFEAQLAPYLPVVSRLEGRLRSLAQAARGPAWAYSVVLLPRIVVRLRDERSLPARTPSYHVALAAQRYRLWPGRRAGDGPVTAASGRVTVAHHSSGQSGCFVTTRTYVGGVCVGPVPTERLAEIVDRSDGSFQTNYVQIGLALDRGALRDADGLGRRWSASVEAEGHLPPLLRRQRGTPARSHREVAGPGGAQLRNMK